MIRVILGGVAKKIFWLLGEGSRLNDEGSKVGAAQGVGGRGVKDGTQVTSRGESHAQEDH